jgi:hypothetical protein
MMEKILETEINNLEARFVKVLVYVKTKDFQRASMTLDDIRKTLAKMGVL